VDSDDEYGRHAYAYRNANASDQEEYDNAWGYDVDDRLYFDGDDLDEFQSKLRLYEDRDRPS
jgi:hypothetical protein